MPSPRWSASVMASNTQFTTSSARALVSSPRPAIASMSSLFVIFVPVPPRGGPPAPPEPRLVADSPPNLQILHESSHVSASAVNRFLACHRGPIQREDRLLS